MIVGMENEDEMMAAAQNDLCDAARTLIEEHGWTVEDLHREIDAVT